jgi:hypothetical protein
VFWQLPNPPASIRSTTGKERRTDEILDKGFRILRSYKTGAGSYCFKKMLLFKKAELLLPGGKEARQDLSED